MASDPFRLLALSYDADVADVRRSFRRRARETHPDRGGTVEAFHAVRAAYAALMADLEGQRRRWRPAASRPADRLPRDVFPTCTVRVSRPRRGARSLEFVVSSRPRGWRPGAVAPPGGRCERVVEATEAAPAFGVWTVPLGRGRFRCVFGPPGG